MADMVFTEKIDDRPNHLVPALLKQLQQLKRRKVPVVTVLSCKRYECVASALRSVSAAHLLYLPLPTSEQREELVRRALYRVYGYSADVLPPHVSSRKDKQTGDLLLNSKNTSPDSLSRRGCNDTNASPVDTSEVSGVLPEEGIDSETVAKPSDVPPPVESESSCIDQDIGSSEVASPSASPNLGSGDRPKCSDESIKALAQATAGFTFTEIIKEIRTQILLQRKANFSRLPGDLSGSLVENKVPLAYRAYNRGSVPNTTWDHIKGYTGLKHMLQRQVSLYHEDPVGHPLRGLLLYGPPGCSKTMFVKALVTETGFSFIPLMCSVVLSKYVGQTEKNLRSLIRQARAAAPSIVFIDEVDALCGERGARGSGGGAPVAELLDLMGSCVEQDTGCANVLFVGATNRPQDVDEGLLQARYLSHVVHVGLPDCESRCALWRHRLDTVRCKGDIDVRLLCRSTEGFSGAEIMGVYQDAALKLIRDIKVAMPDASPEAINEHLFITEDILMDAISRNSPRTPGHLLEEIDTFTKARKNAQLVA